jgi:phosphoglucosamine mutase
LVNLAVKERRPLAEAANLSKALAQEEKRLGEQGRILVRYSGTEPLLRIMVEALEQKMMDSVAQTLCEAAVQDLGQAGRS